MCQLQGCDCTPGSQALGLWASIRGEPFLCLSCETFLHPMGACGTMLHHLRTGASHIYCTAPGGCSWDHAAPFAYGSKPPTYCTAPGRCPWDHAAPFAQGSTPRYCRVRLWTLATTRKQAELPRHEPSEFHEITSWEVAPCCCIRCCRWSC